MRQLSDNCDAAHVGCRQNGCGDTLRQRIRVHTRKQVTLNQPTRRAVDVNIAKM